MEEEKLNENGLEEKKTEDESNNSNDLLKDSKSNEGESINIFENDNIIDTNGDSHVKTNFLPKNGNNLNNINPTRKSGRRYGNIGKNIVLCKKYVFGIPTSLIIFIGNLLAIIAVFIGWVLSNNIFYPFYIYLINTPPSILMVYYYLLAFLVEPGIIPRHHPDYVKKENKLNIDDGEKNDEKNEEKNDGKNSDDDNIINTNTIKEPTDNKDNTNQKNQPKVPRIYTTRECSTCGIVRPPKSSHCSMCDNCILDLDHHCFYISNCVGRRNHKFFYLFLLYSSIASFYVFVTTMYTIIYSFAINHKDIWNLMYEYSHVFFILSLIFLISGPFIMCCGFDSMMCGFLVSFIGVIGFIIIFSKAKPDDFESYRNPYLVLVLLPNCAMGIFSFGNLCYQTGLICSDLTLKQQESIKKEMTQTQNLQFLEYLNVKTTCAEKSKKLWKFLTKELEKSLIVPERDLFPINN